MRIKAFNECALGDWSKQQRHKNFETSSDGKSFYYENKLYIRYNDPKLIENLMDNLQTIFDEYLLTNKKYAESSYWNDTNVHVTIGSLPRQGHRNADNIYESILKVKGSIERRIGYEIAVRIGSNFHTDWISITPLVPVPESIK